jgi:putative transcriptional regulator
LTLIGLGCKASLTVRNDVRALRTGRDLSQGALGEALGVSRQTINAIETGRYLPSLPLAIGLARFFDTTVEELFHPDGEVPA